MRPIHQLSAGFVHYDRSSWIKWWSAGTGARGAAYCRESCARRNPTFSVDDAAVQQHVKAAKKIVDVLDRRVFTDRNPHERHELGRAVALEQHAARATLVHQLVRVLVGILDQVVMVAVVDHLHYRPRLTRKFRRGHVMWGLQ